MLDLHSKAFYAWRNVAVVAVGMASSFNIFTIYIFGVLMKPFESEFGWSRSEMSLSLTILNVVIIVTSPLLGMALDRYGARRIIISAFILMPFPLVSMSMLSGNILHLYVIFALIALVGAGTLPQSFSFVVVKWFEKNLGVALGLSLSGVGVAGAVIPSFAQFMIDNHGWRVMYLVFAAAIVVITLPLVFAFLKEYNPRCFEMSEKNISLTEADIIENSGYTFMEALRLKNYWILILAFFLSGIAIYSIFAHLVPILTDRGVSANDAALYMGMISVGIVIGRVISGYLMDRIFAPYVAAGFFVLAFFGIVVLALNFNNTVIIVTPIMIGLATGAEFSEIAYFCSKYFGIRSFGKITGTMVMAFTGGSAIGPLFAGMYVDRVGNYTGYLWANSLVLLCCIVLILALGSYPVLERAEREGS